MSQSKLSYTERWALVNERLHAEAVLASDETKLTQLASLMASVDDFEWRTKLAAEDDLVRNLWTQLRAAHRRAG